MPHFLRAAFALLLLAAAPISAAAPPGGTIRVRLETSAGAIVVAVDPRHAPRTSANFLAYVDDGRLDGTIFYRAARRASYPKFGFIQGGIETDARRMLPPVPLEPTTKTGLKHEDGTISMAHGSNYDGATGNFSIMVGGNPFLDARPGNRGYAAFGQVVAGMDVVRRILAMPTGGGTGPMRGQMLARPVRLIKAVRMDGVAKPTGKPKPWLFNYR
ncbi:MAG: peptidylprolyl isomerase [Alphaproteobacteria bacterium]|nr:peptidylprolyl isomerase [Alphaproteobacteria bacterium]